MRNKIIGIIAIIILVVMAKPLISFAAMEIERINVDFSNNQAELLVQSGNFIETNSVSSNGDTIEVNSFQPNGASTTISVAGNAFQQIFGGLIQQQAVNMDAITNATMGQTGVYIAQQDVTTQDLGNISK